MPLRVVFRGINAKNVPCVRAPGRVHERFPLIKSTFDRMARETGSRPRCTISPYVNEFSCPFARRLSVIYLSYLGCSAIALIEPGAIFCTFHLINILKYPLRISIFPVLFSPFSPPLSTHYAPRTYYSFVIIR